MDASRSRPNEIPARFPERSLARKPGTYHGSRFIPGSAIRDSEKKPHWFRTLCDANNIQRREPGLKLRYRNPLRKSLPVNLVLLDTSASTRLFQALGKAKGVIKELARDSYLERTRTTAVDIELASFRLGRSRYVSLALGARYLHISELV